MTIFDYVHARLPQPAFFVVARQELHPVKHLSAGFDQSCFTSVLAIFYKDNGIEHSDCGRRDLHDDVTVQVWSLRMRHYKFFYVLKIEITRIYEETYFILSLSLSRERNVGNMGERVENVDREHVYLP